MQYQTKQNCFFRSKITDILPLKYHTKKKCDSFPISSTPIIFIFIHLPPSVSYLRCYSVSIINIHMLINRWQSVHSLTCICILNGLVLNTAVDHEIFTSYTFRELQATYSCCCCVLTRSAIASTCILNVFLYANAVCCTYIFSVSSHGRCQCDRSQQHNEHLTEVTYCITEKRRIMRYALCLRYFACCTYRIDRKWNRMKWYVSVNVMIERTIYIEY